MAEFRQVNVGLPNFALNCYLNSALQTLRLLPHFVEVVAPVADGKVEGGAAARVLAPFLRAPNGRDLLAVVWPTLCRVGPQLFGRRDDSGRPTMQDASEVFNWIVTEFRHIPQLSRPIQELFDIDMRVVRDCPETGEHFEDRETVDRLGITIDEEVRELAQGLRLDGNVEMQCNLGRDAVWVSSRRIAKLPRYLICNMLRYHYKKDEKLTAKVLRRVAHPFRFDTIAYTAPDLKAAIAADREAGNQNAGVYHLVAVLTHRGRSAEGGHYITHVKVKKHWFRFDDMTVKEVEESDIEQLSGAADWHTSSYIIYEAD
jgi:ubiquitin carboxyl-terminal hydrolase 14